MYSIILILILFNVTDGMLWLTNETAPGIIVLNGNFKL